LQVVQPAPVDTQPRSGPVQPGVHARLSHADTAAQLTSHAHDESHATSRHEPLPVQPTLHRPVPQRMPWQLRDPLQLTVHDAPSGHDTPLRHEPDVEHSTLQLQPAGQAIIPAQPPLSAQSIVQVFWPGLHDVHAAGHTPASRIGGASASTQSPSTQTRSSAQRVWSSHAKSLLRWLTAQAAVAAATRASSQGARITAPLRA
jgi:hypothetical protein